MALTEGKMKTNVKEPKGTKKPKAPPPAGRTNTVSQKDLQFFYGKWRKKETHERNQKMNYTARHYAEILDDLQKMFNLDDVGD